MKRSILCLGAGLFFLLVPPGVSRGQSTQTSADQVMKDLLNEVRLLRQDVRKLAGTTYRANTMIERLRLQQSQVNRLTNDLSNVRVELATLRSRRTELKESLKELERKWNSGTIPEADVNAAKTSLTEIEQREPELTVRELELTAQLNIERANLDELNKKLDAIEQELSSILDDTDKRPKKE